MPSCRNSLVRVAITLAGAAMLAAPGVNAASAIWLGDWDWLWSTDGNWSAAPAPGVGDTATFNDTGNGYTVITVGTISLGKIVFDSAYAAAYTLGSDSDTITFADGTTTAVAMASTVTVDESILANLVLGTAAASTTTFTNASPGNLLTLGGNLTGGSGGTAAAKIISISGVGNTTIEGAIATGGASSLALTTSSTGTLTLTGTNTFSGGVTISAGTLILGGSGALTTTAGAENVLTFGASSTGTLVLAGHNAVLANLTGSVSGPVVTNANGTSVANATLTVGNATNQSGAFAGVLQDGGSGVTLALVKAGTGTFTLTGSNTYSGATTISAGTLQVGAAGLTGSLAPGSTITNNSTLVFNRTNTIIQGTDFGTLTGSGALTQAGSGTLVLSGANTYTGMTTIAAGNLSIDSINNLGVSSAVGMPATPPDGTIALGTLAVAGQLTYTGSGDTTNRVINLAGTAGGATIDQSGSGLLKFSADLTATGAGNKTLTLQGSTAGSGEIAGKIVNSITITNLAKTGTGTWTLSGANTYTGTTTVTGGLLQIASGGSTAAGSAVTVASGAIGGSGSVGGLVTLSGSGGIDLEDGAVGTLTLANSLAISGATGANNLNFDLGAGTVGTDKIMVTGNTTVTNAGAVVINLHLLGAPASPGTYPLIQATATMATIDKFALATSKAYGQTFSLGLDATSKILQLTITAGTGGDVVSNEYWKGNTASWNSAQWYSDAAGTVPANPPGYNTNVFFAATGAGNLTSSLGADFEINSLQVNSGTAATAIRGNTLSIGATAANSNPAGNGITVNNSAGTTILSRVGLTASQTWTVAPGAALTVGNLITDFGAGNSLTLAGGGTLNLAWPNTFDGGLTILAGTLNLATSNFAMGGGMVTLGVLGGTTDATLTASFSGGSYANPFTVANISAGTLTINATANLQTFTGTGLLNHDLVLLASTGNTLTFSNVLSGGAGLIIGAGNVGTIALGGANTYTGATTINAGTLRISNTSTFSNTSAINLTGTGCLELAVANQSLGKLAAGTGVAAGTSLRYSAVQTTAGATNGPGAILGTVELNLTNVNPNYALTFGNGSTLTNLVAATYASPIKLTGDATIAASSAVFTGTAGMTISAATAGTKTLMLGGTNPGANTLGGIIADGSGTLAVTKTGSGMWTLSGANTFSGGLAIKAGTMLVNNAGATGDAGTAITLGEAGGNAANLLANSFTVANPINLGAGAAGTLTIGNNDTTTNAIFDGAIDLNGANLTIATTGTTGSTTVNGDVTGTGNLTIINGTTTATATTILNSTALNNSGTITNNGGGSGAVTINSIIGPNCQGLIQNSATSKLVLNNSNTYTAATTITAGTLLLTDYGLLGEGDYGAAIYNNGTLNFDINSQQTLSGIISGSGSLFSSYGTLTITGPNTYTGRTGISGGVLNVASLNKVSGGSPSSNLGAPTTEYYGTIAIGGGSLTGTLRYTGSGETTDRVINLAGSTGYAIIEQAGAGLLKFSSNLTATGVGDKSLTLAGATAGNGEIAGVIGDSTGQVTDTVVLPALSGATSIQMNNSNNYGVGQRVTGTNIAPGTTVKANNQSNDVITLSTATTGPLAKGTILTFGSNVNAGQSGATSLIKTDSNIWTLSGVNSYTGSTTVNGGLLKIASSGSIAAGGNVTVASGAIGGSGNISGTVTLGSSGGIDLWDGAVGTLKIGGNLNITGGTGANRLYFDLGTGPLDADKITVAGNTTVTTASAALITINQLGGTATPGIYTLIAGTGTMATIDKFDLATSKAYGYTYALSISGTKLLLTVTADSPSPPAAWWSGFSNSSWSTTTNWYTAAAGGASGALPGYQTNVNFTTTSPIAKNLANTVDRDFAVNSLNFAATAITNVTINSTVTNLLTIAAASTNGNTLGNGITVNTPTSGSPSHTISANVGLVATQTWTVNTGAALTVSGIISDFRSAYALTKAGDGKLTLAGANTFGGGLIIQAGTLVATTSTSALGATNPVTLGATAGSTAAKLLGGLASGNWYNPIILATNPSTGTLTVGSSGSTITTFRGGVTGSNNLTISNGGTAALTFADAALDNAGTITNAGDGTGTTTISAVIGGNVTGIIQSSASSTLVLGGSNTFSGGVTITAGTLELDNSGALNSTTGAENALTFGASTTGTLVLAGYDVTLANLTCSAGGPVVTNANGINPSLKSALLTIGNSTNQSGTFAGVLQDGTGNSGRFLYLTKAGTGTLTLSGANTYSGGTTVNAGTLRVTNTSGSGTGSGTVTVNNGGTLGGSGTLGGNLIVNAGGTIQPSTTGVPTTITLTSATAPVFSPASTLKIRAAAGTLDRLAVTDVSPVVDCGNLDLVIDATGLSGSVYGAVIVQTANSAGISGRFHSVTANNGYTATLHYNAATITLDLTNVTTDAYTAWITTTGLTGGDAAAGADPDHDSLNNLLEFVVGGQPNPARANANSVGLLPSVVQSSGNVVFTFRRAALALTQPGLTITPEYGTTLGIWTAAQNGVNGVTVVVTTDGFGAGVDKVVVTIPQAQAVKGKLFARLHVISTP